MTSILVEKKMAGTFLGGGKWNMFKKLKKLIPPAVLPDVVAGCWGPAPPLPAAASVCFPSRGVSPELLRSPRPPPRAGAETTEPGGRPAESACPAAPPADSAKQTIRVGPSQQESEHSKMLDSFCLLWACCGVVGGLWRVCLGDGYPLRSVCSLRGPATAAGSGGFHGTPVWRLEISSHGNDAKRNWQNFDSAILQPYTKMRAFKHFKRLFHIAGRRVCHFFPPLCVTFVTATPPGCRGTVSFRHVVTSLRVAHGEYQSGSWQTRRPLAKNNLKSVVLQTEYNQDQHREQEWRHGRSKRASTGKYNSLIQNTTRLEAAFLKSLMNTWHFFSPGSASASSSGRCPTVGGLYTLGSSLGS